MPELLWQGLSPISIALIDLMKDALSTAYISNLNTKLKISDVTIWFMVSLAQHN